MTWAYDPDRNQFTNDHGQRINRHNLPCTEGDTVLGVMGSKHTYESRGEDCKNFGAAGFWDCEVFVCVNPECMRTKNGKRIRPN